jgi:hypothetical protein
MAVLSLVGDYWPSLLVFLGFGALHSVCAQEAFKTWLARRTSAFFVEHFWRVTYSGLSYIALYEGIAALHWAHHPNGNVWLIAYPDWLWRTLHPPSLAGIHHDRARDGMVDSDGRMRRRKVGRPSNSASGRHRPEKTAILFGERRLLRRFDEFMTHYHGERNHQGLGNELITPEIRLGHGTHVRRRERLGGRLRY